jgi:hypothetical protein
VKNMSCKIKGGHGKANSKTGDEKRCWAVLRMRDGYPLLINKVYIYIYTHLPTSFQFI